MDQGVILVDFILTFWMKERDDILGKHIYLQVFMSEDNTYVLLVWT